MDEPQEQQVEQELQEPENLQVPKDQKELEVMQALVKLTEQFVLKLVYPVDSEVDGSAQGVSEQQVKLQSPFWQSELLLIPC